MQKLAQAGCSSFCKAQPLQSFTHIRQNSVELPFRSIKLGADQRRFSRTPFRCNSQSSPHLILYSKPECHLCHGLQDKIEGVLAKSKYVPSPLTDAELEIRDISTNSDWERQYGMSIPILKVVLPGSEDEIQVKRVPPRSSAERVAQYIVEAMGRSQ